MMIRAKGHQTEVIVTLTQLELQKHLPSLLILGRTWRLSLHQRGWSWKLIYLLHLGWMQKPVEAPSMEALMNRAESVVPYGNNPIYQWVSITWGNMKIELICLEIENKWTKVNQAPLSMIQSNGSYHLDPWKSISNSLLPLKAWPAVQIQTDNMV